MERNTNSLGLQIFVVHTSNERKNEARRTAIMATKLQTEAGWPQSMSTQYKTPALTPRVLPDFKCLDFEDVGDTWNVRTALTPNSRNLIVLLGRSGKDPDSGPRGKLVGGDESAQLSVPALSKDYHSQHNVVRARICTRILLGYLSNVRLSMQQARSSSPRHSSAVISWFWRPPSSLHETVSGRRPFPRISVPKLFQRLFPI